jgi:uncharacterized Tic20 family protein
MPPMNETYPEDRLMAAMSHASALLPLMGAAIPIGVWLSQKERSPLLKFQSLQAFVYQIIAMAVYFLMMVCQMVISFAVFPLMMVPLAFLNNPQTQEVSEVAVVVFLIFMGVICVVALLFNVLMWVGGPAYIIIALIGARQVLDGRDFYYPLLGRWIEKRSGHGAPG